MNISAFLKLSPEDFLDIFHSHLKSPGLDVVAYSEHERWELGERVLAKTRIYLDQKYWIYCRDARAGRAQPPLRSEVWHVLKELVSLGKVVCPASFPVLSETFKQRNSCVREETADVVDELSGGIAIQPLDRLYGTQLAYLMTEGTSSEDVLVPLEQRVWTYLAYVVCENIWRGSGNSPQVEYALAKTIWDISVNSTFRDIVGMEGLESSLSLDQEKEYEKRLVNTLSSGERRIPRHDDAFEFEVQTFMRFLEPMILELEETIRKECKTKDYCHVRYNPYWRDRPLQDFPSLFVGSSMRAAMATQPHRYSKGFIADSLHAEYAIPYCDMFLTERNMGSLLTRRPLELNRQYECEILWEDRAIVKRLQSLL